MSKSKIAALILAAGTASRWRAAGGLSASKLVADFAGKPLVRHVAEAAAHSRAWPVIAVTGHAAAAVMACVQGLALTCVHNADYASGLASSLKTGIAALPPDAAGVVVLLGDMPRVSAGLIDRLIDAFEAHPGAAIIPVHQGQRGNPVVLPRSIFGQIAGLTGDVGARQILNRSGVETVEVVASDEVLLDVDTPPT
ncbi:nucleotidyltransferase family protein [Methylovirgula sp. 4M-Z18]|uniref:nucleotidyltransferase family protein n=1 Tax=Methylovirgula sp. 4M-Z18 TaxID=2293567 RepID=UPI001FE23D20|nr:nucleotidyltransferase family protein [Methylovirgula sp. 4M-Z18]